MNKRQFDKIQMPAQLADVSQQDVNEVSAEQVGVAPEKIARLWQGVEKLYTTGLYPAIAVAIRKNNQLLMHRVIGHAQGNGPQDSRPQDKEQTPKKRMQLDTPMCMFSTSKCITATLIYWLQSQHEFSLHQPVSHYLPEFKSTFSGSVTADQLLNHRAGIPAFPEGLELRALLERDVLVKLLTQLRPEWSGQHTGYHATTAGYILGLLIEAVTQKTLVQVVDEVLRQPMGLKYFNYGLAEPYRAQAAFNYPTGVYYDSVFEKNLRRMLGVPLEDLLDYSNLPPFMDAVVPSANAFATSFEVCEFFQMLLDDGQYQGKTILPEGCARQMTHSGDKFEFDRMLKFPVRYSAGFMCGRDPIGGWGAYSSQAFGHLGLTNNLCWADAGKNIAVSLLTSGNPLIGSHILQLMRWVMQVSLFLK